MLGVINNMNSITEYCETVNELSGITCEHFETKCEWAN